MYVQYAIALGRILCRTTFVLDTTCRRKASAGRILKSPVSISPKSYLRGRILVVYYLYVLALRTKILYYILAVGLLVVVNKRTAAEHGVQSILGSADIDWVNQHG